MMLGCPFCLNELIHCRVLSPVDGHDFCWLIRDDVYELKLYGAQTIRGESALKENIYTSIFINGRRIYYEKKYYVPKDLLKLMRRLEKMQGFI